MPNGPLSGRADGKRTPTRPGSPSFPQRGWLRPAIPFAPGITPTENPLQGNRGVLTKSRGHPRRAAPLRGNRLRSLRSVDPPNLGPAAPAAPTAARRLRRRRGARVPRVRPRRSAPAGAPPVPRGPHLVPPTRKQTGSTTAANRPFPHKPRCLVPPTPSPHSNSVQLGFSPRDISILSRFSLLRGFGGDDGIAVAPPNRVPNRFMAGDVAPDQLVEKARV